MRGRWRAWMALALHLGFFAVPIALVLGLLGIAVVTFRYDHGGGIRAGAAAALVAAILGIGMHTVLQNRTEPRGFRVDDRAQPQLWKTIESIASGVKSPPPDDVYVTSEPSAALRSDTGLLGLRCRHRFLEIGLPLIAGLNTSELRAVLARELAHASETNTVSAVAYRVTISVEQATDNLLAGPTKWLFAGYARLYTSLAARANRHFELDADALAVKVAGKRAAITATRKHTAIELAWPEYGSDYLSMATTVDRTPDVMLGFRSYLEHPERKQELVERAKQAIAEEKAAGPHSPPTVARRIEAMKRLPGGNRELDERPAWTVLHEPRQSVPAIEDALMVDGLGQRLPWPEMGRLAGAAHAEQQAGVLASAVLQSGVGSDHSIGGVLAMIYHGKVREVVNPVLNPGLSAENLDQAAIDTMTELLGATVVDALVRCGRAAHEHDWGGPPQVRLSTGLPFDPDRLVRPAVTDPRLVPGLHRALVNLGVPLEHTRPPAPEPEPTLAGLVSTVQCGESNWELLVSDRGLLLMPSGTTGLQRLLGGVLAQARKAETDWLLELATTPMEKLRAQAGAQWIDNRDVAKAHWRQRPSGWALGLELYLDDYSTSALDRDALTQEADDVARMLLRSTADSEDRGDPYGGLGELLGARMNVTGGQAQDE